MRFEEPGWTTREGGAGSVAGEVGKQTSVTAFLPGFHSKRPGFEVLAFLNQQIPLLPTTFC